MLDLGKVIGQVGNMITLVKNRGVEHVRCLESSQRVMQEQTGDLAALRRKVAASKTSWLVADPVEPPSSHFSAPPPPADFTVMATDGSHIDVDRHRSVRCYLINIGSVLIRYGTQPDAALESVPVLHASDEELVMTPPPGAKGREQLIEGALLGIKRAVDEMHALAELASAQPPQTKSLAMVDGSLIMWTIETSPEFIIQALLHKGFLADMETIRLLNQDRQTGLAAYISYPRSTDVLNMLKVTLCPADNPNCDACLYGETKPCDSLAGLRDRDLFETMLKEGERSALFISPSQVQKYYGPHRVHFFYIYVEGEIARVEVPGWVAQDESLLNLTHSLILDQVKRGQGYPVVLSEAHEQAVVTGADREIFWNMVDSTLTGEDMNGSESAKSVSKRTKLI